MNKIKKVLRSGVLQGHLQSQLSSLKKTPLLLVRHDADCGYRYRGRVYSQIIDSIVDVASYRGIESLSVAAPFSRFVGASAHNDPLVFNRSFLRISLTSAILKRIVGQSKALAYKRRASIRTWSKILIRVQPEVVVGVQPSRYLCASCKAAGIPIYDYQHGVIAPDHWWYGKLLPQEIPDDELPSGILCWDKASAEALAAWAPKRGVQVRVLGNPWFKRFNEKLPKDGLVHEALAQKAPFENDKPTILVSLQWGLSELYYAGSGHNDVMCDALAGVIKKTHQHYNWMLRLHPVQLHGVAERETHEYLSHEFGKLSGVEWERASQLPLPVVLRSAQLHITDMSTVVTEAAWFGIPSAVLNPFLRSGEKLETLFREERELGIASLVEQTELDIEHWIVSALESMQHNQAVEPEESLREFLEENVSVDGKINHTNH